MDQKQTVDTLIRAGQSGRGFMAAVCAPIADVLAAREAAAQPIRPNLDVTAVTVAADGTIAFPDVAADEPSSPAGALGRLGGLMWRCLTGELGAIAPPFDPPVADFFLPTAFRDCFSPTFAARPDALRAMAGHLSTLHRQYLGSLPITFTPPPQWDHPVTPRWRAQWALDQQRGFKKLGWIEAADAAFARAVAAEAACELGSEIGSSWQDAIPPGGLNKTILAVVCPQLAERLADAEESGEPLPLLDFSRVRIEDDGSTTVIEPRMTMSKREALEAFGILMWQALTGIEERVRPPWDLPWEQFFLDWPFHICFSPEPAGQPDACARLADLLHQCSYDNLFGASPGWSRALARMETPRERADHMAKQVHALRSAEYHKAAQLLGRRAIDTDPESALAHIELAISWFAEDLLGARELLVRACTLEPDNPVTLAAASSNLWIARGDQDLARDTWRRALAAAERQGRMGELDHSVWHVGEMLPDQAQDICRRILAANPDAWNAASLLREIGA